MIQAALLGLVALVLAPGLTMAVGRYDARRPAVVAFGLLALYLAIPSRGVITVLLAARSWP